MLAETLWLTASVAEALTAAESAHLTHTMQGR